MAYPPLRTDVEIHEALIRRIAAITGLTTIASEQGGPRPELPYCMVSFPGTRRLRDHPREIDFTPERDDEGEPDTAGNLPDVTAVPLIDTEWHFSVFAYGGEAPTNILRPIVSAAELSQVMEPTYPYLVVDRTSQIRYVPEYVNNGYEPRAQMDLFLHGVTQDGFVIDTIDAIPINIARL